MANRSYHRRSGTDLHGMEDFHRAELSHSHRRDVSPSPAFPPYHDTGRSPRNSPLSRGHAEQAPPPSQKKHHRSLSQPFFDPLPVENIAERINALGIPNLQSSPLRATENNYRGNSGGKKGSTRASSKGSYVDDYDNVRFDDDDSSDSSSFSGKGISYYRDRARPGSSGGSRPGSAISSGSGAGSAAGSVTAMSGSSGYGAVSLSREFVFDMRQHPSSPPRHVSARWSGASQHAQPAHAQHPPKELLRSDDEDEDGIEDPEDSEQPPPARRAHTASDAMRGKKGARAIGGGAKDVGFAHKGNSPMSPTSALGAVSRHHTTSNAERRHRAEGGGTGGRRTSMEGGSMSNLSGSSGFSSSTGSLRASVDAPQKASSRRLSASASFNPRSSHAATTFNHSGPHAAAHSGPQAGLSPRKVAGEAAGDAEDTPVADSLLRRPPALELGKISAGAAGNASFSGPVVVGSGDAGREGGQAAGEAAQAAGEAAAGGERGRAAGGGPVLDQSKSGRRAFLGLLKGLRSPRLSGTFDLATGAGLKSPTGGGDDWAAGAAAGAGAVGVSPRGAGGGGGAGGGSGGGAGGRSGSPAEAAAGERKSASRPSLSPLRSPRLFSFSGSKRFDKSPRGIAHSLTGTGSMRSPRGGGDGGGSPEEWTVGTGGKEGILKRGYADVRKVYEVGDKIGEGRPGVVVYACTARRSGRALACKSIDKKTLDDDKKAEALRLEVELMKQLGVHGGIVSVRDAIEDDTHVHLLMELCSGGDLLNFVNTAPAISEQQAATIVRRLADAVRYCHHQGVVHRDLKPENILMAAKGAWWDLRVADFGISAMLKPGERIRGYAGSPFYIAPEVLGGAYGFECDVWSLGVVLYVLLAQKLPFWHDSDAGVYKLILKGHVDTRTGPWTGISRDAKGLVHRMLTSDASQRITLDEVIEHPWVVANQCEVPEAPPPPSEAETKQAKRRRAIARSRANIIASFRLPFCLTPLTNDSVYSDSENVV
ncbi:unnamed protein product [Closterium sp. Yama58-4]|nr:unnamed protein product [Closterium sp. Yama58-4]